MSIAVIKTGGKQYLVKKGEKVRVEKLPGKDGDPIKFAEVLLVADEKGNKVFVGTPYVAHAEVAAKIITQGKSKKVSVIKYKNKIRYRRNRGHRQAFTLVEITNIKHAS